MGEDKGSVAGSDTPSERGRAAMQTVADYHFAESNNKKNPEWKRKAHAHAYGGAITAIGAFDAFSRLAEAGDAQTLQATDPTLPPPEGEGE